MQWKQRLDEEREVVATQLAGMAEVMDNLAGELRIDVGPSGCDRGNSGRFGTTWQPEQWRVWQGLGGKVEIVVRLDCPGGRVRPLLAAALGQL